MKKPWAISAKARGELEVLLMDAIGLDAWTGEGITAEQFAKDLRAAGDVDLITVRINSGGGDCWQGLGIYNALLENKASVSVVIEGLCASIAGVIAMSADRGAISMAATSLFMLHLPYTITAGNADDLRKMSDLLDKMTGSMTLAYQRHASKTAAELLDMMRAETWLSAAEAVAAGFADTVIEDPDEEADMAAALRSPILARCKHVPRDLAARLTARPASVSVPDEERDRLRLRADLLRRLP
jgi:ATP-dependent protease ClpP protease subunit